MGKKLRERLAKTAYENGLKNKGLSQDDMKKDYEDVILGNDTLKVAILSLEPTIDEHGIWFVLDTMSQSKIGPFSDMNSCWDYIQGIRIVRPCSD